MIQYKCSKIMVLASLLLSAGLTACQQQAVDPDITALSQCAADMPQTVKLAGGAALIGSDAAYREEAPRRTVDVSPIEIDAHEVTNAQFAAFVADTSYETVAERAPDPELLPKGAPAEYYKAGSAVFLMPTASSPNWWHYVAGANWRAPQGPDSSIKGKENYPVVQIAYEDALAYAAWAGRRLPDEREWEYAAQGGAGTLYPWGEDLALGENYQANIWQGAFPVQNSLEDGFAGLSPIGCFEPNAFGLYDMIGNAWEWTSTPYDAQSQDLSNPIYTIKGGSYLCAANFCRRYRASARHPQEAGLGTNHISFRTVAR